MSDFATAAHSNERKLPLLLDPKCGDLLLEMSCVYLPGEMANSFYVSVFESDRASLEISLLVFSADLTGLSESCSKVVGKFNAVETITSPRTADSVLDRKVPSG